MSKYILHEQNDSLFKTPMIYLRLDHTISCTGTPGLRTMSISLLPKDVFWIVWDELEISVGNRSSNFAFSRVSKLNCSPIFIRLSHILTLSLYIRSWFAPKLTKSKLVAIHKYLLNTFLSRTSHFKGSVIHKLYGNIWKVYLIPSNMLDSMGASRNLFWIVKLSVIYFTIPERVH